jgi:ADP-heptose:LPS heptosyltransferase
LTNHKSIFNIIDYDSSKLKSFKEMNKFINLLQSKNIDLWIDLPVQYEKLNKIILRIFFAKLCKSKFAFGWDIGNKPYFPHLQIKKNKFQNEVHRLLNIVNRNLDFDNINNKIDFDLPINETVSENTKKLILKYNVNKLPIAIIGPGSKRSANLWSNEKFVKVSRHLIKKGYFIFIIGGQKEIVDSKIIENSFDSNIVSLSGAISVLESACLISKAKICICVDSGAQHLASAVGTKVISLFSGRDFPGMWYPEGNINSIIRKIDICTCFMKDRCEGNKCMNLITSNDVNDILDQLSY